MLSFTNIEEIDTLIYLFADTKTSAQLGLLNKYNQALLNKLSNDRQFLRNKLLVRLGLIGDDSTEYQYILKRFDNGLTLAENCVNIVEPRYYLNQSWKLMKINNLNFRELQNDGQLIKSRKLAPNNKYCLGYWQCVVGNAVKSVLLEGEDTIYILFNNCDLRLKLIAAVECSDISSWFQWENINDIVGKEIRYIYDTNHVVELPESGRDEIDSNHLIIIQFVDGSEYHFYLRNTSNGYYSGYLEINIIDQNDNNILWNTQNSCNYQDYIAGLNNC